jgi:hypothetical protein
VVDEPTHTREKPKRVVMDGVSGCRSTTRYYLSVQAATPRTPTPPPLKAVKPRRTTCGAGVAQPILARVRGKGSNRG